MSYLTHLKRNKHHYSCRWVVKYDKNDLVREVKLVYNPDEYKASNAKTYGHKARKIHTQKGLIKVLENDKTRRSQAMGEVQTQTSSTTQKSGQTHRKT